MDSPHLAGQCLLWVLCPKHLSDRSALHQEMDAVGSAAVPNVAAAPAATSQWAARIVGARTVAVRSVAARTLGARTVAARTVHAAAALPVDPQR